MTHLEDVQQIKETKYTRQHTQYLYIFWWLISMLFWREKKSKISTVSWLWKAEHSDEISFTDMVLLKAEVYIDDLNNDGG